MKVVFSRYAKEELDDAVRFYELQHQGLGKQLRREVKDAAKRAHEAKCVMLYDWPIITDNEIVYTKIFSDPRTCSFSRSSNYWMNRNAMIFWSIYCIQMA